MAEKNNMRKQEQEIDLVRISGKDINGHQKTLCGLTKIKGVNWAIANAICKILNLEEEKKIGKLSKEEIETIEKFIENPELPNFLMNRRKDFDSGEDLHLSGSDLNLVNEFDIKRLKKIKAYKGVRHNAKLPVRGQRTKSNFRSNKRKTGASGIKKK